MTQARIIHRLWGGPKPMPDDYKAYGARWAALNPGWEVRDWTDEDVQIGTWHNRRVITDIRRRGGNTVEAAVQIADVMGYELIYKYGGLYVNVDIEPVRSIEYMMDQFHISSFAAFAGKEDVTTPRVVNAVLGGPPGHKFWKYVIDRLGPRYLANPELDMVSTTGPGLLTDCVYVWENEKYPFKILTRRAFNILHWSEIPSGSTGEGLWHDDPEIIGVHHWGHRRDGRTNYVGSANAGSR